jgi:hydrophobic/amphiphilic exporter-1 (mainly G- bacteria), HAE1 family
MGSERPSQTASGESNSGENNSDESNSDESNSSEREGPNDSTANRAAPLGSAWYGWAVDRPVAIIMVVAAVCVLGVLSYDRLRVALMPELSYPTLTVRTGYEGAAPEEVEQDVTVPLEEVLRTVEGLQSISSVSRAGQSDVVMEFRWGAAMDLASQKVRERVDVVRLPDTTERPLILRYDPDLDPVLRLGLSGDPTQTDLTALRRFAEDEVKRAVEKLDGVAMVKVHGGQEAVITIDLSPKLMQQMGLNPAQVMDRLRQENVNLAGGKLEDGAVEYLVRTLSELEDLDAIRALIVGRSGDAFVRLGQVATVSRSVKERQAITRLSGAESVEVEVYKEADANLVAVAEAVKRRLLEGDGALRADLPPGMDLKVLSDRSVFIRAAVGEVSQTALQGGVLAVLVLFVFLRSAGLTAIIALAIPLSVVLTFAALYMLNVSLNIMSLGGLALGVGMLVDNAIVVLESIFRCREEGDAPRAAAIRGVAEVGGAVWASTLTTVAVFAPIVFIDGVAGQLFGDLALTVVLSLLASLLMALFVVPMLAARVPEARALPAGAARRWLRRAAPWRGWGRWDTWRGAQSEWRDLAASWSLAPWWSRLLWWGPWIVLSSLYRVPRSLALLLVEGALFKLAGGILRAALIAVGALLWGLLWLVRKALWPFGWLFDASFRLLERSYEALLRGALRQRLLVLLVAAASLLWAIDAADRLGVELIPTLHQGELIVDLTFPVETSLQESAQRVARIERALTDDAGANSDSAKGADTLSAVSSFIGQKDDASQQEGGDHRALLTLTLSPPDLAHPIPTADREDALLLRVRAALAAEAGVSYHVRRPTLWNIKTPIAVELRSDDLRALRRASALTVSSLSALPSLREVRSSLASGFPEVHVRLDREALASRQLSARDVATSIQQQVLGQTPTRLRANDRRVDVLVRLDPDAIRDTDDLQLLTVRAGSAATSAVASAASAASATSPSLAAARPVSLSEVARVAPPIEGPSEIRHIEGQRVVVVEASPFGLDLAAAMTEAESQMQRLDLPDGVRFAVTGQREELDSARRNLLLAFGLAVFLVYIVMASRFEALIAPLVIMLSIPLAGVGVVGALLWRASPFSVVVVIGVIMLAGIVVNNAIVLVDYILHLRALGVPKREAITRACAVRLRPVLITTLTTVLGLIPMAFGLGDGSEIRAPMALTVMGGLASSTLLTLLVVPIFYDLIGELGRSR